MHGRLLALLLISWCFPDRAPSDDAWRKLKPFHSVSEARKIFLTEAEAQRLLNACADHALRDLVAAALLTGARLGELAAARVADFDLDEGIWAICEGKTGTRNVVLTARARTLFGRLCAGKQKVDRIFPRSNGRSWGKSEHQRPFAAAVQRASLATETTFYALRHTHISHALKGGVNVQLLAENTGTSVRMIEKHYGKFLRSDRRLLLQAVEPELDVGSEHKVVVLR